MAHVHVWLVLFGKYSVNENNVERRIQGKQKPLTLITDDTNNNERTTKNTSFFAFVLKPFQKIKDQRENNSYKSTSAK